MRCPRLAIRYGFAVGTSLPGGRRQDAHNIGFVAQGYVDGFNHFQCEICVAAYQSAVYLGGESSIFIWHGAITLFVVMARLRCHALLYVIYPPLLATAYDIVTGTVLTAVFLVLDYLVASPYFRNVPKLRNLPKKHKWLICAYFEAPLGSAASWRELAAAALALTTGAIAALMLTSFVM